MRVMPVLAGCMFALWGPLVVLAMYPGEVPIAAGYSIAWFAAMVGGAVASLATEEDRFIPALLAGLWAGCLTILFSPVRESMAGNISAVCVYAFFAVLGALIVPVKRRSWM